MIIIINVIFIIIINNIIITLLLQLQTVSLALQQIA